MMTATNTSTGPSVVLGRALLFLTLLIAGAPTSMGDETRASTDMTCDSGNEIHKDWASVVVRVAGGITAAGLCAQLDSTCTTLRQRRQMGVSMLLERAEVTQAGVLRRLRDLESRGLASNIELKWLTNCISVDLRPSEVHAVASFPDVIGVSEQAELQPMEPPYRRPAPTRSLGYPGGGGRQSGVHWSRLGMGDGIYWQGSPRVSLRHRH